MRIFPHKPWVANWLWRLMAHITTSAWRCTRNRTWPFRYGHVSPIGYNLGAMILSQTETYQESDSSQQKMVILNYFTSCDPHHDIYRFVTGKSSGILSDISSGIRSGILPGISSGISSAILSGKSSGILSGKHSGIPSGILSDILSGIPSGILSGISSGVLSDIPPGISSGILSGRWGPAVHILSNFLLHILCPISSYMSSGREHLAWILAVEVRQGTLGVDGRGWGPAGNTGRGWSWLRSGREQWAGMVVVEVRQGTLGVDGRGWGPTENTVRRGSRLSRRRRRGEEERSRQLT